MERRLDKRLTRLEGKLNTIAWAVSSMFGIVVGFAVYFLSLESEWVKWAPYLGFGAAVLASGAFELRMRRLEKWFPILDDD